ncbi:type I restriction enzyme R subunit [Hamadaea flava]|uniref:DUF4145 domain-containing protein n=1 Tax=Hamadaea flava TaxID=1742688 RepID=A0ABV8LGN3_9ACTN|nr:DUF4145 domain-containing protein [Hamadaea flava]MCP2326395.1 type I restriction enzyme R subunit [Hamadaea flava]
MAPHTSDIIGRSLNFGYLIRHDPLLAYDGASAESYIFEDPDNSLIRSRRFADRIAQIVAGALRVSLPRRATFGRKIRALQEAKAISGAVLRAFERVRDTGNDAAHDRVGDAYVALRRVHDCFELGLWYHNLVTGQNIGRAFVPPRTPDSPVVPVDDPRLTEIQMMLAAFGHRIVAVELRTSEDAPERAEALAAALTTAQTTLAGELSASRRDVDKVTSRLEEGFEERLAARELAAAGRRAELESNIAEAGAIAERDYQDLDAILHRLSAPKSPVGVGSFQRGDGSRGPDRAR